jgi:hypothetical protein
MIINAPLLTIHYAAIGAINDKLTFFPYLPATSITRVVAHVSRCEKREKGWKGLS